MINFARAGGIAAAVLALAATATFADPLNATKIDGQPEMATYLDHASATIDGNQAAQNEVGNPFVLAANAMKAAEAAVPRPRSLGELVNAYAATEVPDLEQDCLAGAVYFEARGEPIEGQLAVAEVVLNRVASVKYPDTICEVVTQKAQFSFVVNGRFPKADRTSEAWKKAVAISTIALGKLDHRLSKDVLWYHADYVAPGWGKRLTREQKIGLHIFYS
jgi:spore germination cell wall hydrolase CwlJ-like protein